MDLLAEGIDINELPMFDEILEDGELCVVDIDLDTILTPEELLELQDDLLRQGVILTAPLNQNASGTLTIAFENTQTDGIGAIGMLTIIAIAVGGFILIGAAIFGWTLWSALAETPWYVWWIGGGLALFAAYKAFVKVGPAAAKASPAVVRAARRK